MSCFTEYYGPPCSQFTVKEKMRVTFCCMLRSYAYQTRKKEGELGKCCRVTKFRLISDSSVVGEGSTGTGRSRASKKGGANV